MAKILAVLYDDPVGGYPTSYSRDLIPNFHVSRWPNHAVATSN